MRSTISSLPFGNFFMQSFRVQVGDWLVTPSANRISYQDQHILLEPRLIDLLVYFAHHPDEVLSRDEIINNVWNRSIVTNHVVTQSISKLRNSLRNGNNSGQEYIVTIPKRGYKLTAVVSWRNEPIIISNPDHDDENERDKTTIIQSAAPAPKKGLSFRKRRRKVEKHNLNMMFWSWFVFLMSLSSVVALVMMSMLNSQPMVTKSNILLNPRDIDIRFEPRNTCNNWALQEDYAFSLGEIITSSLNTFSTFMAHDKTAYHVNESSFAGKTLSMKFINKRHYRSQQCFMLVQLIDNADNSVMLSKRYFITNNNLISVQQDLLNNLSSVLMLPWSEEFQKKQKLFSSLQNSTLMQYYRARRLIAEGTVEN
ncbi:CadC family transcriptional regulator [Salmonella enterica subsp. enterica serovar Bareilly]|nr:CadC family transcriptional regulator [Salmonella enterica subsp. enterica serovar Bareilly]